MNQPATSGGNAATNNAIDSASGSTAKLQLKDISHFFGGTQALSRVSISITQGEVVSLLGPSGCGKTTLLKIIAGFVTPTGGELLIDGHRVNEVAAGKRNVGLVFQNYALFPHLTVQDNVAYGLRARKVARAEIPGRVDDMLRRVQMSQLARRYPLELSGGQQQRVALARALATSPSLVLLDEPFSALDRGLRLDMQLEVKRLLAEFGQTAIIVTHDQEEALSMADRIVVLNQGRIEQVGAPAELYDRPRTLFVNQFLGQANLIPARVAAVETARTLLTLAGGAGLALPFASDFRAGDAVRLSVRPENIVPAGGDEPGVIAGTVRMVLPLGASDVLEVMSDGGFSLRFTRRHEAAHAQVVSGQRIFLRIDQPSVARLFHPGAETAPGEQGVPAETMEAAEGASHA
ncbi:ABC transporter ATP-binding protein [Polaromonas sp. YR568]|uniref:ABC transporter ATP-binding protein n=1 Tax=Polaromonas sp. YR568 TaxID=1855301 RepID=UPI00398C14A0